MSSHLPCKFLSNTLAYPRPRPSHQTDTFLQRTRHLKSELRVVLCISPPILLLLRFKNRLVSWQNTGSRQHVVCGHVVIVFFSEHYNNAILEQINAIKLKITIDHYHWLSCTMHISKDGQLAWWSGGCSHTESDLPTSGGERSVSNLQTPTPQTLGSERLIRF